MADVRREFTVAPWAKPAIGFQPVNFRTLVRLPNFYWLTFAKDGYEPGEVMTSTLLGRTVEIRPKLINSRYDFGDGVTLTTTDKGGPYPDGTIKHAYTETGTYKTTVNAIYTADYRLDGTGPWQPIGTNVTVTSAPATITVLEARARLVTDPDGYDPNDLP